MNTLAAHWRCFRRAADGAPASLPAAGIMARHSWQDDSWLAAPAGGYAAQQYFHAVLIGYTVDLAALNIMNILKKTVRTVNDLQIREPGVCAAHRA